LTDDREFYSVFPKDKSRVTEDEVERLMVVAENNLAEIERDPAGLKMKMVFPDNFQAREFRDKLANYYPNWIMRKLKKKV
jgi:hypothetical protein